MKLYMEVTQDKYRLPLAVADSQKELAEMCGVTVQAVTSSCHRMRVGRTKLSRFIAVEIDGDYQLDKICEEEKRKNGWGRYGSGRKNKLTEEQIKDAICRHEKGVPIKLIADRLGVHQSTLRKNIKLYKDWDCEYLEEE